ncbi:MAG TPA: bifunctional diaminohydroxyphosphoribosylaminopyrimidine deaminase/5-amino-6-(5-phosphoribosylamino)uracil reductase RibD, partial [Planctomycetaceae bacterium]|nr:bifunctional diaminohydroxyphosphoribosylaminopyrimidine deaminase/5-amino-6-(5-phosphoribosylamino)uracil reductase RibD [Planctomycetaceae bacterium]
MSKQFPSEEAVMRRAIELARLGIGSVEPNPAVGAVVVDAHLRLAGEGYHRAYGQEHAEVAALAACSAIPADATLFVTLEPCCHHGKTPPCTDAIIRAGIRRVVVGLLDPSPHANGQGVARLRAAGVDVEVGLLEDEVRRLNAPFLKLTTTGLPYVHAKWAMTLDGKTATRTGRSRWVSNESSRRIVHQLRGRMDAILVGIGTVEADDPLLTARPAGHRVATRVVFDSRARLPLQSQLVRTLSEAPLLIAAGGDAPAENIERLRSAGIEVLQIAARSPGIGSTRPDPLPVLRELGGRRMTNVMIEGGARLLGSFFDQQLIDEIHVF